MNYANAIIVGGPIAVGKSTLVASLNFHSVQELVSNDQLQQLMLRKMYEGDQMAAQIFQIDMMLLRFGRYAALANRELMTVFDRSIFEDLFFATLLLKDEHYHLFEFYYQLWSIKVEHLLKEVGKPQLYILLTCNWDTFKTRIFKRERAAEVLNFERNESYFRKLIERYEPFMTNLLKQYDLPHIIIRTDELDAHQVLTKTEQALKERKIDARN